MQKGLRSSIAFACCVRTTTNILDLRLINGMTVSVGPPSFHVLQNLRVLQQFSYCFPPPWKKSKTFFQRSSCVLKRCHQSVDISPFRHSFKKIIRRTHCVAELLIIEVDPLVMCPVPKAPPSAQILPTSATQATTDPEQVTNFNKFFLWLFSVFSIVLISDSNWDSPPLLLSVLQRYILRQSGAPKLRQCGEWGPRTLFKQLT